MKINYHLRQILLYVTILIIYFVSRIFFYFFNHSYFSDISSRDLISIFINGLRFDLSAIFTLNFLVILLLNFPGSIFFKKNFIFFIKLLFVFINSIALLFNTIDFVYFKFINTRTSAEIFSYLSISSDIINLIPQFIKDFWFIPIIWLIIGWFIWKLFEKLLQKDNIKKIGIFSIKRFFLSFIPFLLWVFISIILIRGGFQLRPLSISSAARYASAKYIPLVLNTPFNIIKTIGKERIIYQNYYLKETDLYTYYNPVKSYFNKSKDFKKNNVIIFILEGFSREHIGSLNKNLVDSNYNGYTPFLDSIIHNSLVFENAFANGKRTIDAPPAILASIPNLMSTAYVISPYASNNVNSLANLLKPKGYKSYFFHGGTNGTMAFDNFAKLTGFDVYFGRKEYNNDADYDGKWGIYDEPFLQRMLKVLDSSEKPFISCVFTLSSHHPYKIPEEFKNTFPKGTMEIHESIGYADFALRMFFANASKTNWFSNTLFIFTADHTTEAYHEVYKNRKGQYNVPIIFYKPDEIKPKISSKTAQHTDILPTILHFLNYDKKFIAFGNSLLDTSNNNFSVNYADGIYQIINDTFLLTFDGKDCLSLYEINKDILLQHNILKHSEASVYSNIENTLKAYIQSYQYRTINNKMTIE